MSDIIKVNACVYSRIGYERESNRDDFYMNGKFLSEHHLDNMQASMENRGTEYFFAVADHMEFSDDEQRASFSILREVGKYHEKITVHEGDLDFKTKELASRVQETGKYLDSFLDLKNAPDTDPARQMGFTGLLLSDGKAIGSTYGTCHIYFCRGNVFKHMTDSSSRSKRLVNLGIISDEEAENIQEKYKSADEDEKTLLLSEPIELVEGDKFLLVSDGVYNALGEENLEDILSMRSDSTYIAYRIISEAAKRSTEDDMTAMVIRIEKISPGSGVVRKSPERPKISELKKSTPPPSYKYKKRGGIKKYENLIYYGCVVLTAVLLILIVVLLIKNIYKRMNAIEDIPDNTKITATISPKPGTESEPTPEVTPEATPEVTPEATPEPTQAEIREYKIKPGDTLSSIAREFYGDNWVYVEKLGRYNKIPAPYDNIIVGQVLKIPPKEVLNAQE